MGNSCQLVECVSVEEWSLDEWERNWDIQESVREEQSGEEERGRWKKFAMKDWVAL